MKHSINAQFMRDGNGLFESLESQYRDLAFDH